MNQKISIIVPVYNIEHNLVACLESIITQTYRYIEIILVNDGSLDASGNICDQYALKDNRISVIHQENKGVTEARRTGWKCATGDWIAFVDGDDILPPRSMDALISNSQHVDIVKGSFEYLEFDKRRTPMILPDKRIVSQEFIYNILHEKMNYTSLWAGIYKRHLINDVIFDVAPPLITIREDVLNQLKICLNANIIQLISEVVYLYVQQQGSTIHRFVPTYNYTALYDEWLMKIFKEGKYMEVYHEEILKYRIASLIQLMNSTTLKMCSELVKRIKKEHKDTSKSAGQYIVLFLSEMPYWLRRPLYSLYSKLTNALYRIRKRRAASLT